MSQRHPRQYLAAHCDFIRSLPCLICADNTSTECAHIRMGDLSVAKPMTGIGTKPDDIFTVPLCGQHHREQHDAGNERKWWFNRGIDPVKISLALYVATGDFERGERIVGSCCNQSAA